MAFLMNSFVMLLSIKTSCHRQRRNPIIWTLKRVAMVLLCCSFFLSTTTSLLAATPEITDLSPEESDSGFEMMLQLRMHVDLAAPWRHR